MKLFGFLSLVSCLTLLVPSLLWRATAEYEGCNYTLFFNASMQSTALKKFWLSTKGPEQWPRQFTNGWSTDEPCAWDGNEKKRPPPSGTRCMSGGWHRFPPDGDSGVMFIEHYSGEAEGEVPGEFKSFQMASTIGLSFNKLRGSIWDTSYHCFLQKLDLSHNSFSGPLQDDFMKRDIHSEIINLAHNKFSGRLPKTISTLPNLVTLLLDHNEFFGEIPDLGSLVKLRHLSLGHNKFSGVVGPWLQKMYNLGWLELEHNNLEGALPTLPGNITRVNFSGNKFSGEIPESYGQLGFLRHFNCTGCTLTCPSKDLLSHLPFSTHCTSPLKFQ